MVHLSFSLLALSYAFKIVLARSAPLDSSPTSPLSAYEALIARGAEANKPTEANLKRATPYWLEEITHQGIAAFNPYPATYEVFRNVKDYGAKGDGVTDDTAAINLAISSGSRCDPSNCQSSTTTPAVVYFPAGTYLISSTITDFYYTQLIGNPNSLPTLKATSTFDGIYLVDGSNSYAAANVFFRQVRNLIFDTTAVPATTYVVGINWPTSQATSLQNLVFHGSDAPGTQHGGVFIAAGSGGFLTDLTFYGGSTAAVFGNQQFTARNLQFFNAVVGIEMIWNWGWTFSGITVVNCSIGLDMSTGGPSYQPVDAVTLIDSTFINTPVAIVTARNATSQPPTAGSLILENIALFNTSVAVKGPQGTVLAGGSTTIAAFGQGHQYTPTTATPSSFEGSIAPNSRPAALTVNGKYYTRSKPGYEAYPLSSFVSARTSGATGNGVTDDTQALNNLFKSAAASGKIVFLDAGTYKVTSTVYIPGGSKVVGESYSVILGSGAYFSSKTSPQAVVRVGNAGEYGVVEWSDSIVSTQGATAGAILIEWNLASPSYSPSGLWDVHTRIGGFAGSNLQAAQCPTTPTKANYVNPACIAAFLSLHITNSATGLYLENTWFWTADHDLEDPNFTQLNIFTGRGLYSSSQTGVFWLYGTAVEHHALYQYQFVNTQNVFLGHIQTETPYYQPNPDATTPFQAVAGWNDPVMTAGSDAWGLRIVSSQNILVYGAGHYSFFSNYSTACSATIACQARIVSIEGSAYRPSSVSLYNLNTIGSTSMVTRYGSDVVQASDNSAGFASCVALYRA